MMREKLDIYEADDVLLLCFSYVNSSLVASVFLRVIWVILLAGVVDVIIVIRAIRVITVIRLVSLRLLGL
jgi:hypothetical protein